MKNERGLSYVKASVASSRDPNSAYQIGGLPRGVFSCSSRIGTTGLKNYEQKNNSNFIY